MSLGKSLAIVFLAAVLAGCSQEEPTPAPFSAGFGGPGDMEGRGFGTMELDDLSRVALGTLRLEDTEHAVTADQAEQLLPIMRSVLDGMPDEGVDAQQAVDALNDQLTGDQVAAILALDLDGQDLAQWMSEQADGGAGFPFPGGRAGFAEMSDQEREDMRATAAAGGSGARGGFGARGERTDEELQSLRETAAAGGDPSGGPRAGMRRPMNALLLGAAIQLLEERSSGVE